MDSKLYDLLKKIQQGKKFFRPANEDDEANIAFKSEVNRLRELNESDLIRVKDSGFVKNNTNEKGYYNIVGPCEITYKGERALEAVDESAKISDQTETLQTTLSSPASDYLPAPESIAPNQLSLQLMRKRLDDLSDHINEDFNLLKRYEDALRFEDDPKRCAKYEKAIEELKASALKHETEYKSLEKKSNEINVSLPLNEGQDLNSIHGKLDALLAGQIDIHQHISALGQAILNRYDAGEKRLLSSVIEKITEAQIQTVNDILEASENNRLNETEMNAAIEGVKQSLSKIEEQGKSLVPEQKKLAETFNAPQLSVKHKLKMSVPIIPLILNYETEFELGSGINLGNVWTNLRSKFSKS